MLSFLSHRKPDYSDSEDDSEDQTKNPLPQNGIPTRFAALSDDTIDTIDFADGPQPRMMITNDLRPDEEIGLTENGTRNGKDKSRNSLVPKIIKSTARKVDDDETITAKQKADNIYAANKSVAESMMDIALLTSNANQLKFLLSYNTKSKTFYVNVALISISLLLQVAVGVSLIVKKNMKSRRYSRATHFINQFVVIGIFLVTVINVFVAAFTTADS